MKNADYLLQQFRLLCFSDNGIDDDALHDDDVECDKLGVIEVE